MGAAKERGAKSATGDLPQPDPTVTVGSGQRVARWIESKALDVIAVVCAEPPQQFAAGGEEVDLAAVAAGSDDTAGRADRDLFGSVREATHWLAICSDDWEVPQRDGSVGASGREHPPV